MKDEPTVINQFECRLISNQARGAPVIFLHGYMFTSDIWNEIGLLRELETRRIPFTAVDMPYGKLSECQPKSNNPDENVAIVAAIADSRPPVIVGASLGGYIALKYSVSHPVAGLLLVAPVMSLQEDLTRHYPDMDAKVRIVYGDGDNIVSRKEMNRLSRLFKTELCVFEAAGHPAYMDDPDRFGKEVVDLYTAATATESLF
ncbi:MAG: alpha/beta fold hydrolase [Thermodesulfobacteriota bacterium]